jgi:hypothetical protein
MENCKACGSQYDPAQVQIPSPLPDRVCGQCGTELSTEKINELLPTISESKE